MHPKAKKDYLRLLVKEAIQNSKLPYNEAALDTVVKFALEQFYVSDISGEVLPVADKPVAYDIKDYVTNYLPEHEKYLLERSAVQTKRIYPLQTKSRSVMDEDELWALEASGINVPIDDPRQHV